MKVRRSMRLCVQTALLILLLICGISSSTQAADQSESSVAISQSTKAYSPFDEPRPKIPQEIIDDKRLGQKVKVFAKSKNMKQLFADLSAKTGVKITANRELWGERPIIYFHKRPLRDVMTEVSGLYGYRWLITGKPGAYTYELFEDTRHAERRDQLRQGQKDALDELLLKLVKVCADGSKDEVFKRITQNKPGMYEFLTGDYGKGLAKVYSKLGEDFLRKTFTEGRSSLLFSDLPPDIQTTILDWHNEVDKASWERSRQESTLPFQPLTMQDMADATIQFNRMPAGIFGMPRLGLEIGTHQGTTNTQWMAQWPLGLGEGDIRTLTDQEPLPEKLIGDKLPDAPAITVPAKRKPRLILGDVLQGIAEQSGKHIIADYYFQEMYPKPADKEPLGRLVRRLCDELDYSCRTNGSMLTFRFNKWFVQSLQEEPPAKLVEAWWTKIETMGRLEFQDLLDLACLPEKQMLWGGFRFMPGVISARRSPATWRLWDSFGTELEAIARTEEGLPVSQLNRNQFEELLAWVKLLEVKPEADISKATIKLSDQKSGNAIAVFVVFPANQVVGETLRLQFPDRYTHQISVIPPTPLTEKDRRELAAQRKADAEADVIEVAQD